MILTAHQPVYMPWLGLFHKIALADLFISFDQVQYVPKDWINRNRVMGGNGPTWLSVPCIKSDRFNSTISKTIIDNQTDWRRKHWNTIRLGYSKARYFNYYADFFEDLYTKQWSSLSDLNMCILTWSLNQLGIKTPVRAAGEFNFIGKKSDLVLDMCNKLGANCYIFGALGKNYADVCAFKAAGIDVIFQDYMHPKYSQTKYGFEPNLAIIDLLFNCGPSSLDILMTENLKPEDLRYG